MQRIKKEAKPVIKNASSDSENKLIDALQKNDNSAYQALVTNYSTKMYAVASRFFHDIDDRQECLQLSFIQVFEHINSFKRASSLSTWLHRITINAALMMIRKKKNHQFQSIENFEQHYNNYGERTAFTDNAGNNIEKTFVKKELSSNIHTLILSLPEKYCNVLLLRDIQELSTRETAEILSISTASVKTNLHRGRLILKELLTNIDINKE